MVISLNNMNSNRKTHRVVLFSLFASLTVVTTLLFHLPIPSQGYLNMGDAIVLLAALVMGPAAGFWVGSIGSALADLVAGYAIYIPFTFLIKGSEGFLAGWLYWKTKKKGLSLLVSGLWMAIGYVFAEWFLFGWPAAIAAFPMNVLQGFIGAGAAVLLFRVLGPIFHKKFHLR